MTTLIPKYSLVNTSNRTIAQKFGEQVSVKDFGAVGDGVADDTAAINAAIAYVFAGPYGGGTVHIPKGNYLTTSTIYVPNSITLQGEGMRANGPLVTDINGSCIIGKHTGVAIISLKGSAFCQLNNICLVGDVANTPKTGLCLGRIAGESSGLHDFYRLAIGGYFTKAAVYSIASEGNSFFHLEANVLGGGALYTVYISGADDLAVDSLATSSNYVGQFYGVNILNQSSTANSAAIYINATIGTAGWLFKGGFTGMTSGASSSHIQINLVADSTAIRNFTFEDIGCEAQSNANPPIQLFKVSGVAGTLRGLTITNCTTGQDLGGTQYYLYSADSIILKKLDISDASPRHPSRVWRLTDSTVNLPEYDFTIVSGCLHSTVNARQIISQGVGGQVVTTMCLAPIYGPTVFAGTGANAMTISTTTEFTGSAQVNLVVEIDSNAAPNTFKWSIDGGSTFVATLVPITSVPQLLQSGIYIVFSQGTGLTIGDKWTTKFDPVLLPTQSH